MPNNSSREVIIISEDIRLKEDYQLVYHHYLDLAVDPQQYKNEVIELYEHSNKLYLSINIERFGSAFIGNIVKKGKNTNLILLLITILSL